MYNTNTSNLSDAVYFLKCADRSLKNVKVSARSEASCNCCCSSYGGGKAKFEEKDVQSSVEQHK